MRAGNRRPRTGNLPDELSGLVGRDGESREVRQLLGRGRLVTLVGVGGTGKTRLALRVATEVRRAFPDGVWFVDLAGLPGPDLATTGVADVDVLAYAVMEALGVQETGGGSAVGQLVDRMAGRRLLLLLDNCDHLVAPCAAVVGRLLRECPAVKVLATSRERLTLAGELVFPVPPLPVPDPDQPSTLAELARCAAVALLVVRAQAADPRFSLTEENRHVVAALCRRLDGLPLAVELAAAWMRALGPAEILDRLDERFTLLSRGRRAAPPRQQTLRACVDWSFRHCDEREQLLWARLSVFVGSFELDAVQGVCADDRLPAAEILDVLAGLVDKSILNRDDPQDQPSGPARYRMLETLREYGAQRLAQSARPAGLRHRHRDWYQQLAAQAGREWVSGRQAYWRDRLDREYPNVRSAIDHALAEPGGTGAVLRLLVALPPQWRSSRGLFGEELRWLHRALAEVTEPTVVRARALLLAAYLAGRADDLAVLSDRLAAGERLTRQLADAGTLAFAAFVRGGAALLSGDPPAAIASFERGLAIAPMTPEPDFAPAVRLQLLTSLGVALGLTGDHDRARRCYEEVLRATTPLGEGVNQLAARWGLGVTAWLHGDVDDAADQLRQALRVSRASGWNARYAALSVEVLAWVAARQQRYRVAAVLLGAADALSTEHDKPIRSNGWMVADHDACERRAREVLGVAAFEEAVREGRNRSDEEIVALALDEAAEPVAAPRQASTGSACLTRREREVADLVARGLSNKQIGSRLTISQRTAESHVEHILAKLGFTSRAQVAAWIAAGPPGTVPVPDV